MRLKKLELFGFKSFADKTTILFDEGVTCVVGPNGCGKSNISDSIRWVLGERSAKLLRGTKMDDLIFNGTEFRKALAFAEVSLTIDNTDRGLAIEYQEVTLTRRLYRTGVSEYAINRTPCRLKDIEDLILNTGIGSSSYSMIEQGRIDYILNADAEERRFLIEEAAGISKYKVKKEEAIRKLERTEENLLRLKDIVYEVQKNIQYAERQARRAERYKVQFEKLKDLEIRKSFYDLKHLEGLRNGLNEERGRIQTDLDRLNTAAESFRREQADAQSALQEILNRYSQEEARRYGLSATMEQIEQQGRFNQEKRMETATRNGQIQQELTQLQDRIVKSEIEIAQKQQEIESFETQKQELDTRLKQAEDGLQQVEDKLKQNKTFLEAAKSEAFQASYDATQVRNEYHRLMALLESNRERQKKQHESGQRFSAENQQLLRQMKDADAQIIEANQKLQGLNERKRTCAETSEQLRAERASAQARCQTVERSLHEKESRLSMLREIDAGTGVPSENLLNDTELQASPSVKDLREIFAVQEGYECALEAILECYATALVAEDGPTAAKLLKIIFEKKSLPAGILIRPATPVSDHLESQSVPDHVLIDCALKDVIAVKPGYESVLWPFVRNVYVIDPPGADDLQTLISLHPDCCFVTRDGTVVEPAGRIYARQGKVSSENNFFRRGKEIGALGREISELRMEGENAGSVLARLDAQWATAIRDTENVDQEIMALTIQMEALESERRSLQDKVASFSREVELITLEIREMEAAAAEASQREGAYLAELRRLEDREKAIGTRQEGLSRDLERVDQEKDQALKLLTQQKTQFEHLAERHGLLQDALTLMVTHLENDRARIVALADETQRLAAKQRFLDDDDKTLQARREETATAVRDCEVRLELVRHEKEGVEKRISQIQAQLQELVDGGKHLQEGVHQAEMKSLDLGYQEKTIHERIQQIYRINLHELDPELYPISQEALAEADSEITGLREKVESLGTVNLLAIEEYEELKQRYDFLTTQQRDLENARESLMEAIRKINRTTKTLFEETLINVQKTFQEYYETLFRGGQARLVLTDETNPLESGLDIVVRPPGKKLQHISLLSGGEKALTAMALLFALMQIKPSPFCVLDEVDAPLDEANIDRFLSVLRTFLDRVQFIIVTHNRKTIMIGDSLYGVTMEDAGVSKLVSVKVNPDNTARLPYRFVAEKQPEVTA